MAKIRLVSYVSFVERIVIYSCLCPQPRARIPPILILCVLGIRLEGDIVRAMVGYAKMGRHDGDDARLSSITISRVSSLSPQRLMDSPPPHPPPPPHNASVSKPLRILGTMHEHTVANTPQGSVRLLACLLFTVIQCLHNG